MNDKNKTSSLVAYLGLGSNQGNSIQILQNSIDLIAEVEGVQVLKKSSFYESDPYFLKEQNRFLNGVIKIGTFLDANTLLEQLQGIEKKMGRTREIKNGPRTLDIDILSFGDVVREDQTLSLPHPGVLDRSFVLIPLVEIAPNLVLPTTKKTVLEYLAHRAFPKESFTKSEL